MLGKHLVFLDSSQFMSSSPEKLVENIKKCGKWETCSPGECIKYVSYRGHAINPIHNQLRYTSKVN